MPRNDQRFTVYDVMERRGMFASNPANPGAHDESGASTYAGPVEFPKMFYHPEGLERVTKPAEVIATPLGPKEVGEQKVIITAVANNAEEEARLRDEGWHDHPSKALAAAGKPVPAIGSDQRIQELERQAQMLREQLELAKSVQSSDRSRRGAKAQPVA